MRKEEAVEAGGRRQAEDVDGWVERATGLLARAFDAIAARASWDNEAIEADAQALLANREALNETVVSGQGMVADSFYRPNDPLRSQLESAIPQYPFDLNRAQQLLAQAGWVRGSDGVLVHQQTGERLELEINGGDTRYIKQEQNIVADSWKKLGIQVIGQIRVDPLEPGAVILDGAGGGHRVVGLP